MKRVIPLILLVSLVIVITPAMARGRLRTYIQGKVEGRAEWFHWGTLGTSKPELKLELRGTKSQGNIVKYEWDFGDGSTAEGEYVTHTYYSGNWNITLTVYDKRGRSASETLKIQVRGGQPQAVQREEPDIEERIKRLESEIAELKKKMTEILKRIGGIEQKFYGKGELKKAEKKKPEKSFTWNYKERLIITVTGRRFVKHREFAEEMSKVFGRELNVWGSNSFLDFTKEKTTNNKKLPHYLYGSA